jgi:hypothetical protein
MEGAMSRLYGDDEELTDKDASIVKGMIARGDKNETIAAYFGVNQRAVSHVRSKKKFPEVPAASASVLPPPGPYGVDPIYVRFYKTMTRVDELWQAKQLGRAKALLEAALHNPVFVEKLDDVEEELEALLRDEFGLLKN